MVSFHEIYMEMVTRSSETDKNLSEILSTLPKIGLEVASIVNLAEDLKVLYP